MSDREALAGWASQGGKVEWAAALCRQNGIDAATLPITEVSWRGPYSLTELRGGRVWSSDVHRAFDRNVIRLLKLRRK